MPSDSDSTLNRRDLLKASVAGSLILAGRAHLDEAIAAEKVEPATLAPAAKPDLIRQENSLPGSNDWQLTRVRVDKSGYRAPEIEGYCSRQSVAAGEKLDFMVSTNPAVDFVIEIFRTGCYGGAGARLMTTLGPFPGAVQTTPAPGEKNIHECRWTPSASIVVPEDWPSGVYLGRLSTAKDSTGGYWQNYVVFIVKDDRPADILFQCSDNTWQAYNKWPDNYSIYTHPKGVQGPWADVSFDRPYCKYAQIYSNPQSLGSGEWLCFEFPFAYWLESQGYDVTYCSNSDMLTPDRGLKCKTFLSVGHDEYWDLRQFESVTKMRDEGVNLLFFSGNSICWVTPFRESSDGVPNRIIFRGGPYGEHRWAEEREKLFGPFPHHGPDEGALMGGRNVRPVNGGGDWIVSLEDHWMFEGTGLKNGDCIPGLVGWEFHGDPPEDLPSLEVVAQGIALNGGVNPAPWSATMYSGPKENFVFNASTIFWCQGLSSPPGHMLPWSHHSRPHGPDARVQKMTKNLIDRAIAKDR
ncbi:MAG TPA: N,N-dimethylformamidase beta subunit family domain-containing protein [Planctomicrobium sp.]|nr:N,N-dimethylformamidase beta subunit family domain-containing protein [Planctomicrobium sp.]